MDSRTRKREGCRQGFIMFSVHVARKQNREQAFEQAKLTDENYIYSNNFKKQRNDLAQRYYQRVESWQQSTLRVDKNNVVSFEDTLEAERPNMWNVDRKSRNAKKTKLKSKSIQEVDDTRKLQIRRNLRRDESDKIQPFLMFRDKSNRPFVGRPRVSAMHMVDEKERVGIAEKILAERQVNPYDSKKGVSMMRGRNKAREIQGDFRFRHRVERERLEDEARLKLPINPLAGSPYEAHKGFTFRSRDHSKWMTGQDFNLQCIPSGTKETLAEPHLPISTNTTNFFPAAKVPRGTEVQTINDISKAQSRTFKHTENLSKTLPSPTSSTQSSPKAASPKASFLSATASAAARTNAHTTGKIDHPLVPAFMYERDGFQDPDQKYIHNRLPTKLPKVSNKVFHEVAMHSPKPPADPYFDSQLSPKSYFTATTASNLMRQEDVLGTSKLEAVYKGQPVPKKPRYPKTSR